MKSDIFAVDDFAATPADWARVIEPRDALSCGRPIGFLRFWRRPVETGRL
jgi:hypothetical protein